MYVFDFVVLVCGAERVFVTMRIRLAIVTMFVVKELLALVFLLCSCVVCVCGGGV